MEKTLQWQGQIPKDWIESEFLRRKAENPSYSLRSFASYLKVPPGRLSEILSGKRRLSKTLAISLADRMGLSPQQKRIFLAPYNPKAEQESVDSNYALLEDDTFALIADWYHLAFLAMMDLAGFRSEISWIARRLGISTPECRAMVQRLERLGLIRAENRGYLKTHKDIRTPDGFPSAALRKSHRESILQSAQVLDSVPVELRDITSMTMAIDTAKLPLAKSLIREFRYKLAGLLESGKSNEVYNLNIQLVPVTKKEK